MLQVHESPQGGCPAGDTLIYTNKKQRITAQMMQIIMRAVDEAMLLADTCVTVDDSPSEIDRQAQFIADVANQYARSLAEAKKQLTREIWKKEAMDSSIGTIPCRVVRAEHLGTVLASVP